MRVIPIVNTWDQCVAAGGDRVFISYRRPFQTDLPQWSVHRVRNGREVKTDPKGPWYDHGNMTFSMISPSKEKEAVLAQAITWANGQFGHRDFVRNKMGDYVERDVNERFPIPPRKRQTRTP